MRVPPNTYAGFHLGGVGGSFAPKREGKIGGEGEGEGEGGREGGRGRKKGVLYPTLSRHGILLLIHVDDWSSPSLTTNLSIALISTCGFYSVL